MPNYCYNRLLIEGADDDLDKLADAVVDPVSDDPDDRFSYEQIIPLAGGDEFDVWGTTSVYCLKVSRAKHELTYEFESSWDPPLEAVRTLASQWPSLSFEHVYVEPLTDRYGAHSFGDGLTRCWYGGGGGWSSDGDDMRDFLESEWPELAAKWWDGHTDEDEEAA